MPNGQRILLVKKSCWSKNSTSKINGRGKGKAPAKRKLETLPSCHNSDDSDDETFYVFSCEPFSNSRAREKWIECSECEMWAHEDCTDKNQYFICPNCSSDDDIISHGLSKIEFTMTISYAVRRRPTV